MRHPLSARSGAALGSFVAVLLAVVPAWPDGAEEVPLVTRRGCLGMASYGVGLHGRSSASLRIDPPGSILGAYIYWVGNEDETPPGAGTSTLRLNGQDVAGTLAAGPAGFAPTSSWYAWWASIGPPPGLGVIDDARRSLSISGWDAPDGKTNGATIVVIYDASPCQMASEIALQVGVDWYYFATPGEPLSDLLVHRFDPAPYDRRVTLHLSHAGTKSTQPDCRGGAVWMLAGRGPAPTPTGLDIVGIAPGGHGFGMNGGVEIGNDPFTSARLPCTPRLNPLPDEPYEPGHPCPGGAAGCPYRALSMLPSSGGDVGPEWAVVALDLLLPADSEWIALQLESELDENGESGSWAGTSLLVESPSGCSITPTLNCLDRLACNDSGRCEATLPCDAGAVACSVDPVTVTCTPGPTYPLGVTDVRYDASGGGNTMSRHCEVAVHDCEPPECLPPPPLVRECTAPCGLPVTDPAIAAFLAGASARDNCAGATVRSNPPEFFSSACAPGAATPVVFTARDAAGYEETCAAPVTVVDTTPPDILCPPPRVLSCDRAGPLPGGDPAVQAWLAEARATDVCSSVTVDDNAPASLAVTCPPGAPVAVRFTARDACGLESACTSTLSLVDDEPPDIACPPPLTIACPDPGGIPIADARVQAWLASAHASDACGPATLRNDAPPVFASGCAPGLTHPVTFTAVDGCGSTALCTSSLTVVDPAAPSISCPPPLVLECPGPGGIPVTDVRVQDWLSRAQARDLCRDQPVQNDAPAVFPSDCAPGTPRTVTFTASDACGSATCTSTVTVVDPAAPTITCPPPLVLECPGAGGIPASDPRIRSWLQSARAEDVCADPPVRHDAPALFPSGCDPGLTRLVTFTASDGCGTATCTSSVTVRDATAPTINCPPELQLLCESAGGIAATDPRVQAWIATATADDVCGPVSIRHAAPGLFPPGCDPGLPTPVSFFARDACGLESSCLSSVRVIDAAPPIITCPPPLTIPCTSPGGVPASNPRIQAWLGSARAADVCSGEVRAASNRPDFFPAGCTPGHDTPVTWTAIDDCQNTATCESVLTVEDSPPEILPCMFEFCIWPPNHEYVCFDNVSLQATVVENCGDPTATLAVLCESSQCDDAPCPEHPGEDGDGNTINDCVYDSVLDRVCVRSERAGSDPRGRYYTISFQAIDTCGPGQPSVGLRFWIPHDTNQRPAHCIVSDWRGQGNVNLSEMELGCGTRRRQP